MQRRLYAGAMALFLGAFACVERSPWAEPIPTENAASSAYGFAAAARAHAPIVDHLSTRFAPPAGAVRPPFPAGSFAAWLRELPLYAAEHPVHLYTGEVKPRQDVHAAVIALDVPRRDLQQCADAVMRLYAEYLYSSGRAAAIAFHPDPGKPRELRYTGRPDDRAAFQSYLLRVFSAAGSASLQAEMRPEPGPLRPGDVLIQGGHPGHVVMILDVAERASPSGAPPERFVLIAQSYMPAQDFHVVKNPGDAALSPWFRESDLATGLLTPEWRPFFRKDVRRFAPLAGAP